MPPQNRSKVPVGTVLEGKFRITREIGRGGMAAVYEAENIDIGKRVAVKILAAELITSRVVRERFIREARAAAAIRSPYICDVYDSGMYEERPFLVMELLEGESLYDMLSRLRRLDPDVTLTITIHAARGLQKAHESNVVHRDLKPENIFLTHTPEGDLLAKILDFGLAKFYEPTEADAETVRLTREGALFGTPAYMSPEQAKGLGEVDHRADLWALACIVYECLTGQTVWSVDQGVAMILAQIAGAPIPRPSKLRPELPPAFEQWFKRALSREPNERFQTAREFGETLAEALKPVPVSAPSVAEPEGGSAIDELIENLKREIPAAPAAPAEPPRAEPTPDSYAPSFEGDVTPPAPDEAASVRPPPRDGARAIALLFGLSAVALGAYALWLYVLHPPGRVADVTDGGHLTGRASASASAGVMESDPAAQQLALAQDRLRQGDATSALAMFRDALNSTKSPVARSLMSHTEVVVEENKPPSGAPGCRVTGMGRPRPFDATAAVSRPTIAVSSGGPIVAFVDNHLDEKKKQTFAVQLDGSLRRIAAPLSVTPEGEDVRYAQLMEAADKLALLYSDAGDREPGVYVRQLEPDGRIASPARRVSAPKRTPLTPAISRADDGTFWVVWEEDTSKGVTDLMARQLAADLTPLGEAVRLTAFVQRGNLKTLANEPAVAVGHGFLYVLFSVERAPLKDQVMVLRVPLGDPALKTGLGDSTSARKKGDRFVGTLRPVSPAYGKNSQARIVCVADGCLAAWDDELAGAYAAFIDKKTGEALWHREFASGGQRPEIASAANGAVIAWFEKSRLKLAPINRDGVGAPTILTRVSGSQPNPDIAPGAEPGQWYISWRDYEAGHFEAFVLRTQCK